MHAAPEGDENNNVDGSGNAQAYSSIDWRNKGYVTSVSKMEIVLNFFFLNWSLFALTGEEPRTVWVLLGVQCHRSTGGPDVQKDRETDCSQ